MKKLKVIHLEDSPTDSELLTAMLDREYALELIRVDSEQAFNSSITDSGIDLIISDFTLPSYSGAAALRTARQQRPEVPFIFFSGTIGEESAIEALHAGATDYILKHRPQKMLAAIERALRERDDRESRLKAETDLRRAEETFRALIENTLDVISVIDRQAHFTFNSPSIERVLGYTPEELFSTNCFHIVHADDLDAAQTAFARALASPNETITIEIRVRHKSGEWRNLEIIGKSLLPGSAIEGVVINSRDVTEKRLTEAQLLRAQRMECLGVLAGGISHDLNNILSPVLMGSELLKVYTTDAEALALIESIQASAQRGSDIVKQVLSFARGVKGDSSNLDLKPLVYEVVKLLRETFPKNIQFQTLLPADLQPVLCNPTELHQVLMNLCVNARDAMPEGGLLQVKAANVTRTVSEQGKGNPGNYVRLTIADSGTGIPPEVLTKIFDPFFTTKEEGRGTGLGLSTVLSIVKRHNGHLEVESVPGEGTQFHIFLAAAESDDACKTQGNRLIEQGRGERILLVDDESAILEMARVVLENSNYTVAVASDGVQALRTVYASGDKWDLVITDASMPIMDGPGLIHELHRLLPGVPIICTTGQGSGNLRARIEHEGVQCILNKPYTADQLLSAASDILKQRREAK